MKKVLLNIILCVVLLSGVFVLTGCFGTRIVNTTLGATTQETRIEGRGVRFRIVLEQEINLGVSISFAGVSPSHFEISFRNSNGNVLHTGTFVPAQNILEAGTYYLHVAVAQSWRSTHFGMARVRFYDRNA